MKRSDLLPLVLITSALASCQTSGMLYTPQYDANKRPATASIPPHWQAAFSADSCAAPVDNSYYHPGIEISYQLLPHIYTNCDIHHSPVVIRGGFGHHGEHLNFSS